MMEGEGRTVVVTGSSRGIGRDTAALLGALGYKVAVHYASSAGPAEELVAALRAKGGEAEAFQADVSDPGACQELIKSVVDRFGALLSDRDLVEVEVEVQRRKPSEQQAAGEGAKATVIKKKITITGDKLTNDQRVRMLEIAEKCPVNKALLEGVDFE